MNLLKSFTKKASTKSRIVREECAGGATGAGDVAGGRGLLFSAPSSMIKRFTSDMTTDYNKPKKEKKAKAPVKEGLGLSLAFAALNEGGADEFDQDEVISRLKSLENKESADQRDIVSFGVEDDDGQVVRVTIRADQAEEFEKALQSVMAEFEEDENTKTEIAEVLYKLKDNFDIVDVVWPEVEEDEEVEGQEFGDEQGAPGEGGDALSGLEGEPGAEGDMGDLGAEGDLGDLGAEDTGGDEQVGSLLSQVIDMMTADAAARKADAEARIADAKAREQEIGAKSALAKIKQEEQFLDMDDQVKKQKEQEKEAKRLAQLAKWKHDMGGEGNADADVDHDMGIPAKNGPVGMDDAGGGMPPMKGQENEEVRRFSNKVGHLDLARRLLGRK